MITATEINGLMKACNAPTLRVEILQIIAAAKQPMCCQDIYKKSSTAPDSMTLSREVHLMTVTSGLLEVAEKKPREGFREVSFYRLTALGRAQLNTPGEQMQPTAAKVQPNTSIPPATKETTMAENEPRKQWLKEVIALVKAQPGITRAAVMKKLETDSNRTKLTKAISNGIYHKALIATGEGDDAKLTVPEQKAAKTQTAPPPKPAARASRNAASKPTAKAPAPAPVAAPMAAGEYLFAFGARKDGGVSISKDGATITLTRHEVQTILAHTSQEQ